jgi:hypothetical protein
MAVHGKDRKPIHVASAAGTTFLMQRESGDKVIEDKANINPKMYEMLGSGSSGL